MHSLGGQSASDGEQLGRVCEGLEPQRICPRGRGRTSSTAACFADVRLDYEVDAPQRWLLSKLLHSHYFSRLRAITIRLIWLVPS